MPKALKIFLAQSLICLTIFLSVAGGVAPVMAQSSSSPNNAVLVKLEKKFFEHSYPSDSDDDRIGRLEKLIFGETKSGDPAARLADIQKIVSANDIPDPTSSANKTSSASPSQGGNTANNAPQSAPSTNTAATAGASYPRVDALEELLLGQTYKTTQLEKRLGQLEKKAFGRPSTSDDMSARTDALEQYWQKSLSPALNQKYDRALTQLETQVIGQSYPQKPIIERLQTLEGIVFPNDPPDTHSPIKDQLETLANAVQLSQKQGRRPSASGAEAPQQQAYQQPQDYGQQQQAASAAPGQYGSYTQPTGSYGQAMGYSGAPASGAYGMQSGYANTDHSYPGQSATNSYQSNGQYTTSQATPPQENVGQLTPFTNSAANNTNESYGGSTNGQAGEEHKGHPLLKGLAKALGAAAGMAAGAVGSGMMYGGGGYGYGGYPMGGMGYGGYPMGGYGGYPMGGMGYGGMNMNFGGMGSSMGRWW